MTERFGSLLGRWTGLERLHPSPISTATTARASVVFALDVDATVVLQDYRQVRADGVELSGHGVFQRDPVTGLLRWWFFDSSAQPPEPAVGEVDGSTLTMDRSTHVGRTQYRFRSEGDRLDHHVLLHPIDGGVAVPVLTGRYQRISSH